MNLLLIESRELSSGPGGRISFELSRNDPRFAHLRKVLHASVGDVLKAGVVGRSVGEAELTIMESGRAVLEYRESGPAPAPLPIRVLAGLVRPIQAQRMLKTAATFGIAELHFAGTELGEKSYREAGLWKAENGEYPEARRLLLEGAAQGGTPNLPLVRVWRDVRRFLEAQVDSSGERRLLLDNGEGARPFGAFAAGPGGPVLLALGSERGWTAAERELFTGAGFAVHHLGHPVLRSETALVAGITLCAFAGGMLEKE